MSPPDYAASRQAAVRIVAAAHTITRYVQHVGTASPAASDDGTSSGVAASAKQDDSPVTVADYAAQAFITLRLAKLFPEDAFIAEETSAALRASPTLLQKVTAAVQVGMDAAKVEGEMPVTPQAVLEAIDRADAPGNDGRRTWMCVFFHYHAPLFV